VSVRAVGTVFGVEVADQRVDVTVTEGAVEVTPAQESPETSARRVTANQQAVVISSRDVEVRSIRGDRAERHFAWREGMVDFDGESLADAVAEINRHNRRKIVVDDPTLASRPVVGIFRASDAEGFAATIAAALGASRVDTEDGIRLQPRPAQ
jgi:transmembrane sensor